jgi:hypothetical protein
MSTDGHSVATQAPTDPATIVRAITVIMGTVVGLAFLFGFGNVSTWHSRVVRGVPVDGWPFDCPAIRNSKVVYEPTSCQSTLRLGLDFNSVLELRQ